MTSSHAYDVVSSEVAFTGRVVSVRVDIVAMPGGGQSQRDVIVHPGAVGVVALDESGRVMMLSQYRHPVRQRLWEVPAGILDVPGEPGSLGAARELAEEAGLTARRWDLLLDVFTSPGMTDEAYRLYLARDLAEVPASERYVRVNEEAEMTLAWIDLDVAVSRIFTGEIVNGMAVAGLLACARARDTAYAGLRPVSTPWPARPGHSG